MTAASDQEAREEFARAWLRANHEGYPDPEWSSWARAYEEADRLAREMGERVVVWRTSRGAWRICEGGCRKLLRGRRR